MTNLSTQTLSASSATSLLEKRFNELSSEIASFSGTHDEKQLRLIVDERRFVLSSLQDIDRNRPTKTPVIEQADKFIEIWTKRIEAQGNLEEITGFLWNNEICDIFIDCAIPHSWNWEKDWTVLVRPSHEMFVACLLDRGQKHILIFDSEDTTTDYTLLDNSCLHFAHTLEECTQILDNFKAPIHRVQLIPVSETPLTVHEKNEIKSTLKNSLKKHRMNFATIKSRGRQWITNLISNSEFHIEHPHISFIKPGNIDAAIIVAPGPSLSKNIHHLKNVGSDTLIICVLHALPRLIKEGITPDIVIHIDSVPDEDLVQKIREEIPKQIPLFIVASSMPDSTYHIPSKVMAWTGTNSIINSELSEYLNLEMPPIYGANISLYAFNLCGFWQIPNIILIGQDLSYDGDKFYVEEDGLEGAIEIKKQIISQGATLEEVPGYYGGTVKTPTDFSLFIKSFQVSVQADIHKNSQHFNCTEGGAKLDGFKQLPLIDLIKNLDLSNKHNDNAKFSIVDFDKEETRKNLKRFFNDYLDVTKEFLKHVNTCAHICSLRTISKNQTLKQKMAEEKLKELSGCNGLLEAYLSSFIVEATKDNHGMINTLSSKVFYQKLRNEVYSFRKLIDKFMP